MNKRQRAFLVVKQLKNDEWDFIWDEDRSTSFFACRNDLKLWVGNGGFFTDINEANVFGYLWRHYVYWFAAIKKRNAFIKKLEKRLIKN